MNTTQRYDLFLSIYLSTRGFAFILAEGAQNPVDWGITEVRGSEKNRNCMRMIDVLVRRYRPDVLILEDTGHRSSWRSRRVQQLNAEICVFAQEYGIPVTRASREDVRAAFRPYGAETKEEIAEVISERIPVLARYVPLTRKPWMTEDARMALFDAAALLFTATTQNIEG